MWVSKSNKNKAYLAIRDVTDSLKLTFAYVDTSMADELVNWLQYVHKKVLYKLKHSVSMARWTYYKVDEIYIFDATSYWENIQKKSIPLDQKTVESWSVIWRVVVQYYLKTNTINGKRVRDVVQGLRQCPCSWAWLLTSPSWCSHFLSFYQFDHSNLT